MAKFVLELPDDIMKDLQFLDNNSKNIFGEMTRAGAEVVKSNVLVNMPSSLKKLGLQNYLIMTRTYETPSDRGINTKVMFTGYINGDKKKPAPLIANAFEYGTTKRYTLNGSFRGQITKKPFMRKSFNKGQIEKAMLQKQIELSKGLLKNE